MRRQPTPKDLSSISSSGSTASAWHWSCSRLCSRCRACWFRGSRSPSARRSSTRRCWRSRLGWSACSRAFDLMLFYVSFEFTLIPLFFMIGMWGGPQRRYAAVKFFLYTLAGSLITLVGLVALVLLVANSGLARPCSLPDLAAWLATNRLSPQTQVALFLALSAGFMVKVPVLPFHTWLPLAHVEAPTAGSILLGRRAAEARHVRLPADLLAAVARGLPDGRAAVVGFARRGRDHLRLALCARAARRQEARRLFEHRPLGFLLAGVVRAERRRHHGRRAADDQPRPLDRRVVPPGRHDLRALPHAAARRPGRPRVAAAAAWQWHWCSSRSRASGCRG